MCELCVRGGKEVEWREERVSLQGKLRSGWVSHSYTWMLRGGSDEFGVLSGENKEEPKVCETMLGSRGQCHSPQVVPDE